MVSAVRSARGGGTPGMKSLNGEACRRVVRMDVELSHRPVASVAQIQLESFIGGFESKALENLWALVLALLDVSSRTTQPESVAARIADSINAAPTP